MTFFIIAGPCVLEEEKLTLSIAREMKRITSELGIKFIFKASFDKANRTSINSFRGPGIDSGLDQLKRIKDEVGVPILTDIHESSDLPAFIVSRSPFFCFTIFQICVSHGPRATQEGSFSNIF